MVAAAPLERVCVNVGVDGDPQSPGASIMEQDAPRLQPPLTLLCHPGRRFSAGERWRLRVGMGGDLVAIGAVPPTICLFLFLASLAWRCGMCGAGYRPGLLMRRSVCVPVACAGLTMDRGSTGDADGCV
jgi:hypothetical protein